MKKNKFLVPALVCAAMVIFGCASTSAQTESQKESSAAKNEPAVQSNHPFGIEESEYANLMKLSLYSKGNNYRLLHH
ncbi:MAG: hypothetical protein K6A43_10460 [Treponema sp.]|nr:hypothetical protein [Treponema sp.]